MFKFHNPLYSPRVHFLNQTKIKYLNANYLNRLLNLIIYKVKLKQILTLLMFEYHKGNKETFGAILARIEFSIFDIVLESTKVMIIFLQN